MSFYLEFEYWWDAFLLTALGDEYFWRLWFRDWSLIATSLIGNSFLGGSFLVDILCSLLSLIKFLLVLDLIDLTG